MLYYIIMPGKFRKKRIGGARVPKRRLGLSRNQIKTVRAIAKEEAMTLPEKKVFGFQQENRQLYHNKTDYLAEFLSCKQGTADDNDLAQSRLVRLGDELLLQNVNIRLWLSSKNDRPNVIIKAFLFWYTAGVTLSDPVCWFTQTNKMLDRVNNEQISIIDSQTIFSGPSYATGVASDAGSAKEHSYLCTLNGNWKGKKITYDEGGAIPKKRDIGLMVVAYDSFGTLQSDIVASYAYNAKISFIDP